jgi:DNA-binding transcriptional regulator YdaS (Cro superfamily)
MREVFIRVNYSCEFVTIQKKFIDILQLEYTRITCWCHADRKIPTDFEVVVMIADPGLFVDWFHLIKILF